MVAHDIFDLIFNAGFSHFNPTICTELKTSGVTFRDDLRVTEFIAKLK